VFLLRQVRIAELLGVAGTDVPIAQIEKLIPPYKVSGFAGSFRRKKKISERKK